MAKVVEQEGLKNSSLERDMRTGIATFYAKDKFWKDTDPDLRVP